MNADGSELLRLTEEPAPDEWPSWSPDGHSILFTTYRDGESQDYGEIYRMDADGGNLTRLTHNVAEDWAAVYSPDGTQIAFSSLRDGNEEIYVMNADGSEPLNLTHNSAVDRYPDWTRVYDYHVYLPLVIH